MGLQGALPCVPGGHALPWIDSGLWNAILGHDMSLPVEKPDFRHKLQDVPHKPGVYIMRDRLKRVIYVGKARSLRKRLSSYFMPSRKMRADVKTRALIDAIWDFEIHVVRSEPEALLLEGKLIKDFRPRYNISFRDDKRFLLVKVNLNDLYPRFQLSRVRKEDGARYFGPFAHSGALRATLNLMKKRFGLRSCRPLEPGESDYKHCLDHIIKNCAAPCIGRITREAYVERVQAACEFLEGRSQEMVETLEKEMQAAAAKLDFERAAQLRDMVEDLKRTTKPMRRFTRHSLPSTVDPASDLRMLSDALRLNGPPAIMECFDISNISSTHIVASMVCFRDGVPDKAGYRRYRIRTVKGQDDFASMAEVVRRRYSRVLLEAGEAAGEDAEWTQESPEDAMERLGKLAKETKGTRSPFAVRLPDLVIVDGGKGQLGAACKELQKLGLHELPIIGLAKEFEEIYRPAHPLPLQLPQDSGALRLLQRIRDEAHRFANGYHQLLMKRRIGESILDDCPGISETRKQNLLKKFGSVQRLRVAPVEAIAATDGIGPRLAADLKMFLDSRKSVGSSLELRPRATPNSRVADESGAE